MTEMMSKTMPDMFDIFSSFKDSSIKNNTTNINLCEHCNTNSLVYQDGTYYFLYVVFIKIKR